jgi:uncharacterized protein YbaA (DUF1428 family)
MGVYIDCMVTPVQKRKMKAYVRLSRLVGKVWREHGALEYCECLADDVSWGKRTSFPRSVKLKRGEVVCLAYIVFKSRRHRDQVNAKGMKDARMGPVMHSKSLPFDMKRIYFGGFKPIVSL